jgi:hypothetical protein
MKESKLYRMSAQQEEMWINATHNGISYWNFLVSRAFKGRIDVSALMHSLEAVVRRHSGLRTGFIQEGPTCYQLIHEDFNINTILEYSICDCVDHEELSAYMIHVTRDMLRYQFNPAEDLLFRIKVFVFEDLNYIIILFNHLICDYISTQIFWRDLVYYYNNYLDNTSISIPNCRQYYEYIEDQVRFLESSDAEMKKAYWSTKINTAAPFEQFISVEKQKFVRLVFEEIPIPVKLMSDLRSLALKKRVVLSAIFQLAYYIILQKYSGQKKVTILNIFHSRGMGSVRNTNTIGLFADTLFNTIELDDTLTLSCLLQQVHSEIQNSIFHSQIPYREVFYMYKNRFRDNFSIFQADFNMLKMNAMESSLEGLVQYELENNAIASKFDSPSEISRKQLAEAKSSLDIQSDISLTIKEGTHTSKVRMGVFCNPSNPDTTKELIKKYMIILEQIVHASDHLLKEIFLTIDKARID